MRNLIITITFAFTFTCNINAQNEINFFNSRISYVQAYGLEDKTTIDFIKLLLLDTNNLIVIDGCSNLLLKAMLNKDFIFWDNEEPSCDSQIDALRMLKASDKKNIVGYNNVESFPDVFFKTKNSIKYDQVIGSLTKGTIHEQLKFMDSTSKIKLCNELAIEYSLSPLDSLIFLGESLSKSLDIQDIISIGINKKIIYLYNSHWKKDGISNFINTQKSRDNIYFMLAKTGSKRYRRGLFSFKNRIKNNKQEFSLLSMEELPSKITLSRYEKFSVKEMDGFHFIYVSKLNNCVR